LRRRSIATRPKPTARNDTLEPAPRGPLVLQPPPSSSATSSPAGCEAPLLVVDPGAAPLLPLLVLELVAPLEEELVGGSPLDELELGWPLDELLLPPASGWS